ncbi:MAG TPA: hypothetical protein VN327_06870 [Pseudonocardiaceae bacterium]|jgi:hypothetical protein|nr:hypothetical protein [Pseudonocardiaceae bacterium]
MFGKTRHTKPYYVCAPKKGYVPEGHPAGGTFFARKEVLPDRLSAFVSAHVFGAYRRSLPDSSIRTLDIAVQQEREQRIAALCRGIADTEAKIKRTVRNLELVDDPDQDFIRDITERRAELRAQKQQSEAQPPELKNVSCTHPTPT